MIYTVRQEDKFRDAVDYYITHVGIVKPGIDLENKKFVLAQLYKLKGGTNIGLLEYSQKLLEHMANAA